MTEIDIDKLKQEADQRLFEYITLIENTNDSLLSTLKQCVSLLSQFSEAVPDKEGFKTLIKHLNAIINAGEQVVKVN
jgi:hypothetical protein